MNETEIKKYEEFKYKHSTAFHLEIWCEKCEKHFDDYTMCGECGCEVNVQEMDLKYCIPIDEYDYEHFCSEECVKEYYDEKVVKNDKF